MPPTVALALALLEENYRPAHDAPQQTVGTRLALRVLQPHVPREWLVDYWEACGHHNGIHRQQNMIRCLNGIKLRLKV